MPKRKEKYIAPQAVSLSGVAQGACTLGSAYAEGNCATGANAGGNCNVGSTADNNCINGSLAANNCNPGGNTGG